MIHLINSALFSSFLSKLLIAFSFQVILSTKKEYTGHRALKNSGPIIVIFLHKSGGFRETETLIFFRDYTLCNGGRWLNSLCKAVVFAPFLELRVCRRVSQEQKIDVK